MNEISKYLTKYNAWRRGEDPRTMEEAGINPTELGVMIDRAIKAVDLLEEIRGSGSWYWSALEIDTYKDYSGEDFKRRIDALLGEPEE